MLQSEHYKFTTARQFQVCSHKMNIQH